MDNSDEDKGWALLDRGDVLNREGDPPNRGNRRSPHLSK